jgi:site-specific DNA recombinase
MVYRFWGSWCLGRVSPDEGTSRSARERLTERLDALERKEDNLLDLAADGEMPRRRSRRRSRLSGMNARASGVTLTSSMPSFEVGRQDILALDLLDQPQELYRQAGPAIRRMLNKRSFPSSRWTAAR